MTEAAADADKPFRILPRVTPRTEHFWRGGADGRLRFLRCQQDGTYVHPPQPVCPVCLSKELEPEAVSGRATVVTYTVNHQPWIPGFDPPFVVAIVAIAEQPDVRLTTNIVGCPPENVRIGMDVQVQFQEYEDVWIPVFAPAGEGTIA
jgi:uncharacterized OB-fold protein